MAELTNLPPSADGAPEVSWRSVRWWPAGLILILSSVAVFYVRVVRDDSHQHRNIHTMVIGILTVALLLIWALLLSRLRWSVRLVVFGGVIGFIGLLAALFEIHGVTGDLVPVIKFRWAHPQASPAAEPVGKAGATLASLAVAANPGFPQFLGPDRNATLPDGPRLARDWTAQPPQKLWRQPIGAAWSGFAVAGNRAVTQEQQGNHELVACYELLSGRVLWTHADAAVAGVNPIA
jgi:outer membrane protein assembly factor BamB